MVQIYSRGLPTACPCRKGTTGLSSSVGDRLCPKAMTRSKASSCKLGVSSYATCKTVDDEYVARERLTSSITLIPRQQISSAIALSSGEAPSARPKRVSIKASPFWTSRSQMRLSAQDDIFISSGSRDDWHENTEDAS